MNKTPTTPLIARSSLWSGLGLLIFGALLPGAPLYLLFDPKFEGSQIAMGVFAVIGALIWIGGSVIAFTLVTRLDETGLESKSLFGVERLPLDSIAGFRRDNDGGVTIEHKTDSRRQIDLPAEALRSPAWQAWLATLADLDANDQHREAAVLERDHRLGDSVDERRRTILRLRRWMGLFSLVGIAISVWGLFYPRPYVLAGVFCIAAPIVAILLTARWRPAVSLIHDGDEWAGGSVVGLWVMPCIAASTFGLRETVIDWQIAMLVALGPAVLLLVLSTLADRKMAGAFYLIFGGVVAYSWAWGGLVFANVYLDHAPPRIVIATVVERHGEAKDEPALTLSSPALPAPLDSIDVSERRWLAAPPGSTACLEVYPGRFGWRYAYVTDCPVPPLVKGS